MSKPPGDHRNTTAQAQAVPDSAETLADVAAQQSVAEDVSPGAGKAAALLPGFAADTADGRDLRGIAVETRALGSLLCARDVAPPLAVGLFGDWGVGKSFFMGKLRAFIDRCVAQTRDADGSPFCRRVLQVSFNAWHYVDANLWASLVSHIFDAFVTGDPADTAEQRALRRQLLLDELEVSRAEHGAAETQRLAAERDAEQAREAHASCEREQQAAREALDRAIADDPVGAVVLPELEPAVRAAIRRIAGDGGGRGGARGGDAPVATAAELEQVVIEARTSAGLLRRLGVTDARGDIRWRWTGALAALLAAAAGGVVGARAIGGSVSGALAAVVAGAAVVSGVILPRLRQFRRALASVDAFWQRRVAHRIDVVKDQHRARIERARRRLDEAEAALDEATRAEAEAVSRKGEVEAQLRALDPAVQFRSFVEERARSADYKGELGIIAKVRRDFERLSDLLARVRSGEAAELRSVLGGADPVDRIVLYIDDLDRCPSERVIEVLQAVHLLLAFPLFAVVVAVDPRWLLRAITTYYPELLDDAQAAAGAASAHDYLEKIFQIPYTIEPMSERAAQRFVSRLLDDDARPRGRRPRGGAGEAGRGHGGDAGDLEVDARALVLEPHERAFLADMAFLVRSPRRAKRLVNTYRMVRVAVPPGELDAFVGTADAPGSFRAAVILVGTFIGHPEVAPSISRVLSTSLATGAGEQPWTEFLRQLEAAADGHDPDSEAGRDWRACLDDLARLGAFTRTSLPATIAPFLAWLRGVRRYSFVA